MLFLRNVSGCFRIFLGIYFCHCFLFCRLRNLRKKVVAEEELVKQKTEKRKLAKVAKLAEPTMLSGNKFEDPELEIKLTDELTGKSKK